MLRRARDGTCLEVLVNMAIPLCQRAQRECRRTRPGRPPCYQEWQIAALIMIAVLHRRKSKSSQWRFIAGHRQALCRRLALKRLPARSVYFQRYRRAHELFQRAVLLQGRLALRHGVADATVAAADKSMISARGPTWRQTDRLRGIVPPGRRGVDRQAAWSYSPHDGWVYGYSFEVVVTATPRSVVFPLLASAGLASASEHQTLRAKLADLPAQTRYVLTDTGYDSNALGEQTEYLPQGRRSGRRYLCPPQARFGKPAVGRYPHRGRREQARQRRAQRVAFYQSPRGQRLYAQRRQTVEPFNEWLKKLFELQDQVWHRGQDNNRTQLLCSIFCYQLLVRYNHRLGRTNGQIQWILDTL